MVEGVEKMGKGKGSVEGIEADTKLVGESGLSGIGGYRRGGSGVARSGQGQNEKNCGW